jgi:hypothetical protein
MLSTDIDLTVLEDMEFAPQCEYSIHSGDQSAEWICLYPDNRRPCGCLGPSKFFCTPCKEDRNSAPWLFCIVCHEHHQTVHDTAWFEPIGRPS